MVRYWGRTKSELIDWLIESRRQRLFIYLFFFAIINFTKTFFYCYVRNNNNDNRSFRWDFLEFFSLKRERFFWRREEEKGGVNFFFNRLLKSYFFVPFLSSLSLTFKNKQHNKLVMKWVLQTRIWFYCYQQWLFNQKNSINHSYQFSIIYTTNNNNNNNFNRIDTATCV